MILLKLEMIIYNTFLWRNDTRHNDTLHKDTPHGDTKHNDTKHNDTQHNHILHNDNKCNVTLSIMAVLLC